MHFDQLLELFMQSIYCYLNLYLLNSFHSPRLPVIGGYLIPHENPAVGQHRSKPA